MKDDSQEKGQGQGYKSGVINIQVIFKPTGMDEITEGGTIDRKQNAEKKKQNAEFWDFFSLFKFKASQVIPDIIQATRLLVLKNNLK